MIALLEPTPKTEEIKSDLVKKPEVVDDFIRNFLSSKDLVKTLNAFQVKIRDLTILE